jgi:hypothetical protein
VAADTDRRPLVCSALGSALGGFILGAATGLGRAFPAKGSYTAAARAGIAVMALAAILARTVRVMTRTGAATMPRRTVPAS